MCYITPQRYCNPKSEEKNILAAVLHDFNGMTAVITGDCCGIGKAIAEELINCGAKVWYCSSPSDKAIDHPNAIYRSLDVSDSNAVKAWFKKISQCDVKAAFLINNAGCDKIGTTN